jgi:hypothetical protein
MDARKIKHDVLKHETSKVNVLCTSRPAIGRNSLLVKKACAAAIS